MEERPSEEGGLAFLQLTEAFHTTVVFRPFAGFGNKYVTWAQW